MRHESQSAETAVKSQDSVPSPEPTGRNAPAGLPPELDRYLRRLLDSATRRTARDPELKCLFKAFSADAYADADLSATIKSLDVASTGASPRAKICAWLLGLPFVKPEDRARAATALGALIRKPAGKYLKPARTRIERSLKWTTACLVVLSAPVVLAGIWSGELRPAGIVIWVLSACFLPAVALITLRQRHIELRSIHEVRFIAAHALGRLSTMEALDAVSAACSNPDYGLLGMDFHALRALLPVLTVDHYGHVSRHLVPNLCRLLVQFSRWSPWENVQDEAFAMELLNALEKVGDGRAIPAVEWACQLEYGPLPAVAERVLVVLKDRKRRETERATLLRGAATPAINPSELLRTTAGVPESATDQLLRPTD